MTTNPTERFSNRVDYCVCYRPRYPQELMALLREEIGLLPAWIA